MANIINVIHRVNVQITKFLIEQFLFTKIGSYFCVTCIQKNENYKNIYRVRVPVAEWAR